MVHTISNGIKQYISDISESDEDNDVLDSKSDGDDSDSDTVAQKVKVKQNVKAQNTKAPKIVQNHDYTQYFSL